MADNSLAADERFLEEEDKRTLLIVMLAASGENRNFKA